MAQSRATAARIIADVMHGHSLGDSLPKGLASLREVRDRAFVQALCFGVCRYFSRLEALIKVYLSKPLKSADADIQALLLVGLYQLIDMRVAAHAAVGETVQATQVLGKPWARGLVNAVLRRHQREGEALELTDPAYEYAHPTWWIDALRKAWPNEWQAILLANNEHPPFALRVNQRQLSRESYLSNLQDMPAKALSFTEAGIVLAEPVPVEALPGFEEGQVSVQDGAAQLSATLLDLAPNLSLLDACAAPGGKLCHILEHEPSIRAVGLDIDPDRLTSIQENLTRLQLQANLLAVDAGNPASWWDQKPFDRILLDAPCSASGVIRRHPDIKLLRKASDIEALAREQMRLINALWQVLAPGGLLVYATCSVFPQENVDIVQAFLAKHSDATEEPIAAEWGIPQAVGRQILPGMYGFDGFYYARLRKSK